MLLQKPSELIEGHSEVVNDVNWMLTNFWKVLQLDAELERFTRIVEATPFSEYEFDASECGFQGPGSISVHHAVWFFIRYRQSRQGIGNDFATLSRNRTRRGMNEQVSSWLTAIEGLPEIHERLKRVVILCHDALSVIKSQDGQNTMFYLDPPYLHSTRSGKLANKDYEFEMTEEDHARLLRSLTEVEGHFILSGYRSDLYDSFASVNAWRRVDIEIDNKASSAKTKEKKIECLWMNY